MSASPKGRKGQPLIFLALVLVVWAGGRTVAVQKPWAMAFAEEAPLGMNAAAPRLQSEVWRGRAIPESMPSQVSPAGYDEGVGRTFAPQFRRSLVPSYVADLKEVQSMPGHNVTASIAWAVSTRPVNHSGAPDRFHTPEILNDDPVTTSHPRLPTSEASRWRVDGWLLSRSGGAQGVGSGQQAPSYGASQIGAVIAYRLAPSSSHKPAAYLRASQALRGANESEASLGLSLQVFPRLPVTAHAELRATRRPKGTELRPSVFVAGGIEDDSLPLQLRARSYGAAGYVGGGFATAFVDGHAVIDRRIANLGPLTLSAGAGAWGGAQRDAARLDTGPTASIEGKIGRAPVRLSVDYRYRAAGNAAPASGAAVTLSTGF